MATKKKGASARRSATKKPAVRKPAKRAARRPGVSAAASAQVRRQIVEAFQREHERTRKVLRALPSDHAEMRPHPRSKSTRELAFMFVAEQALLTRALKGELGSGPTKLPAVPERLDMIADQFEQGARDLVGLLESLPEAAWGETIQFPIGPGPNGPTLGDWTKQAFAWFMLSDQIHHRGQMSIYLRMSGGRVPAIYGPSSDEPWR